LELVQSSRTAAPINVALQLPASENNARLTDKFPSTMSVWQILRRFESGTAGGQTPLNFTQRGIAKGQDGTSGPGRLYYETPVVNVMGRELASFVELQKSLTQLGVTSGSALLRMSFKATDQPLEDAMVEISRYFETESNNPATSEATQRRADSTPSAVVPEANSTEEPVASASAQSSAPATSSNLNTVQQDTATALTTIPQTSSPEPTETGQRSLKVFLAPTTSTPAAAAQPYNENDYVPTIEHAKLHQARLNNASRNQRLLSNAELAKQEEERQVKLKAVAKVKVRIRFPDQTTVETTFGKDDCGHDVYEFVKNLLANREEAFSLMYVGSKAGHVSLKDGPQRLIANDGWKGNMLISFIWNENVSDRVKKQPVLRDDISRQAVPMMVEVPKVEKELEERSEKISGGILGGQKGKDGDRQKSVEAKLKGFLGLGKKK